MLIGEVRYIVDGVEICGTRVVDVTEVGLEGISR